MDHDSDDEDWYDDEEGVASDEFEADCPECGEPVPEIAGRCPTCGYWLTDADAAPHGSAASRPLWIRITVAVLLLAFLVSLLAFGGIF